MVSLLTHNGWDRWMGNVLPVWNNLKSIIILENFASRIFENLLNLDGSSYEE